MATVITGYPFDSGTGAAVQEGEWSRMEQHKGSQGVQPNVLNEFEVYADSSGMQVKVKTGHALIKGNFAGNLTSEQTLSIATAHATLDRIDAVIIRIDWADNEIELDVLTGTPAASPVAPTLTQTEFTVWEFLLAYVDVGAAVSTIAAGDVSDERVFARNDGTPNFGDIESLTISSGAITVECQKGIGFINLAGEGAAADTLTTINASNPKDGDLLLLRGQSGYVITIANSGNILLGDFASLYLSNKHIIPLVYDAAQSKYVLLGVNYGGKKAFSLNCRAFTPLGAADPTPDIITRNSLVIPILRFNDAEDNYAGVAFEPPDAYNGGELDIYITWFSGNSDTNSVVWYVAGNFGGDGETITSTVDSDTIADAVQGANDEWLRTGVLNITPTGTYNPGDLLYLMVGRLGTDGSDTSTANAFLVSVRCEYDVDKEIEG